jgi:formylglycine-generating enzyme required for sulfatase activity
MPDTALEPPFPAYSGTEPFIFVSYAHKDDAAVFPELQRLRDAGYRIWFDEGIDPGTEWPVEVARALRRADQFLVFLSPAAAASRNVGNEIHYALKLGKRFLAVYLSETELPEGLDLSISAIQALLKYRMSAQNYWRKLEQSLPATLRETSAVPAPPGPLAPPPPSSLVSTQTGLIKKPSPGAGGPWTNSLGMEFVPVPGTEVLFGIWDVRVQDCRAYAEASSGVDASWKNPGFPQGDTHPVVNVTWEDAKAFCAWLSRKEGKTYRLPTDAEWSVAVGLGPEEGNTPRDKDMKIKNVYPWGNQWPPPKGAGNYSPSLGVDDFEYTSPVGSFAANRYGLYDMGGNVWQWCEDYYDGNNYSRVLRGGSWGCNDPDLLLSSYRVIDTPGDRDYYVGFRVVLVAGSSR